MTAADVLALVERLDAWSHDERLGDGMLVRQAAELIRSLIAARDAAEKARDQVREAVK